VINIVRIARTSAKSTLYESVLIDLLSPLSEQGPVNMPRAMQNANDLNTVWNNSVEDEVGELKQGTGVRRYVQSGAT